MTNLDSPEALCADFIAKVDKRECVIATIGLGYVGLPLMLGFSDKGFPVLGLDIDRTKIDALMRDESYFSHIPSAHVAKMTETGRFRASDDFSNIDSADAILICVPTPLTKHHEPDVSYIVSTAKNIAPYLRKGQIVILESTTYPGTLREVLQPLLEEGSGLRANKDFFVAYSPEREDPGNQSYGTTDIPKVVGASTKQALDIACSIYEQLVPQVVRVSTPDTAEAVKLTENIFRAVNIALVNELKIIYDEMGINVWEVIDAAKTKPFGFMPFYPGPGLGGHCIPIDPFYLTWKAKEFQLSTRFIELAGEINRNMPSRVISVLAEALSQKQQKALSGANILVIGISYKKNIDDMRESPSLALMEILQARGAIFDYHDPFVPVVPKTREHANLAGLKSKDLTADMISGYDAILISTDHDKIDWKMLVESATLVIDTRNVLKESHEEYGDKIVRA
jgi:UDP-N-acetyl-D-glucosamine dehydrogenase